MAQPPTNAADLVDLAARALAPTSPDGSICLHATGVALDGKAVLFLGAAGRGKSTAALGLMAQGATLIADDLIQLRATAGCLWACRPETAQAPALIEARGVGLLPAGPITETAVLDLVVDFDAAAAAAPSRLPNPSFAGFLGVRVPLIPAPPTAALVPVLLQILRHGPPVAP